MGPLPPDASGNGSYPDSFSGIDPELMARFVTLMERAREVVDEETTRILAALSAADVDRTRALQCREVVGWLDREIPELRRRGEMIRKAEADAGWEPGTVGLLAFNEDSYLTPQEAASRGRELAGRFTRMPHTMDSNYVNNYDELGKLMGELEARRNDADFTSAFFAATGLKGATYIVEQLRKHDLETTGKHRRSLAEAVNTAITKRPGALGPEWRPSGLKELPADVLGVLIARGAYSKEWLLSLTRSQVGGAVESPRGKDHRRWMTGLAPFVSALADNPEVARTLFNDLPREDLIDLFSELNRSTSRDFDAPAEFGRMLAAGSGVFEEGSPGSETVKFAFNTMTTMSRLRDPANQLLSIPGGPMEVAKGTRGFMAMIAGAYPAEIIDGAHRGDANRTKESALGASTMTTPGLAPKFRLSPEDTYLFMKTFADTDAHLKPFEEGMGRFARVLLDDALREDGGKGIENLSRVFAGLGYVHGTQLAAAKKVREDMDAEDQARNDKLKLASDALFGVAGVAVPPKVMSQGLWILFSLTAAEGLGELAEIDDTRVDALDDQDLVATLGRGHWILNELHRAGFGYTTPPNDPAFGQPPIADADGRLLPFNKLLADPAALKNFNNWMIANGSGSWKTDQAGQAADDLGTWFNGTNKQAQRESEQYEKYQELSVTPSPSNQSPPSP